MISLEKLKEFREHILYLAIRGKLVEQRPEEGTAEDLYQQIQEEKQKLIKEGKIKKEKTLAPIEDDEIPFDIPESWKWVRISDCIQVNPSVKFNDESEVSFIPMINIEAGYKSTINLSEVKLWKDVKKNFSKFQNEDVIVAKITPCFQNRKSAIAKNLVNGYGAGTTELNILRTGSLIDNLYLLYFAKSSYFINYGIDNFSGTVGQQRFGGDSLKQTLFPLPPLAEQKRIASKVENYLSVINKAEDLLNRKVDLDAQIKEKILQMAIQGNLVEQRPEEGIAEDLYQQIQEEKQKLIEDGKLKKEKSLAPIEDDEIPFDIPSNWKWGRLKNICSKIVDGDHNPPKGENSATDYLMLSASNINQDALIDLTKARYLSKESYLKENERTKLEKGDILLTTVGTIGRSCIFQGGMNICFQRSVTVISTFVFNKYLKYMLDSNYVFSFMNNNAKGTAQKGFYLNQVDNLVVPIPPLAEQKRIVAKVEELLALCDKLKLK